MLPSLQQEPDPEQAQLERETTEEIASLLGHIVMVAGQLEALTNVLFVNMLGNVQFDAAMRVVAGQNFTWVLDRIAVMAEVDPDQEHAALVKTWVDKARAAYIRRNNVVHGLWVGVSPDGTSHLAASKTRGGRYVSTSREFMPEDLAAIHDALSTVTHEWADLIRAPNRDTDGAPKEEPKE